jgi:hypothetical protein
MGDGWFEGNAKEFGFSRIENHSCCHEEFAAEVIKFD